MDKSEGKVEVGAQVMVLSDGNAGKYGIVRQNLGFHSEDTEFDTPDDAAMKRGRAMAHRSDTWWWVEAQGDNTFNVFIQGIKLERGPMGIFVETVKETQQVKRLFFPDKELMPIPPIEAGDSDHTDVPTHEHPTANLDA